MARNLDLASLRSLVTVIDAGGMTRAANRLNLTQSAVSMQIKRLEEVLSCKLLERHGRLMRPTAEGEELISFARRLVGLNDEAIDRLTVPRFEGTLRFGVPYDIVHPYVPDVLRRFGSEYPRLSIKLTTGMSADLREALDKSQHDIILTTESRPGKNGRAILRQPLVWTGAPQGRAWKQRPLPIAFTRNCMFRAPSIAALDRQGIAWVDAVSTMSDDAAVVASAADLGVRADLTSSRLQGIVPIDHQDSLPSLPNYCVVVYCARGPNREAAELLAQMLEQEFSASAHPG
jgi:DNA-binding transcriptional LysR family regulator